MWRISYLKKVLIAVFATVSIICTMSNISDAAQRYKDCPNCGGKGYTEERISTPNYSGDPNHHDTWVKHRCWRCHGTGIVERP